MTGTGKEEGQARKVGTREKSEKGRRGGKPGRRWAELPPRRTVLARLRRLEGSLRALTKEMRIGRKRLETAYPGILERNAELHEAAEKRRRKEKEQMGVRVLAGEDAKELAAEYGVTVHIVWKAGRRQGLLREVQALKGAAGDGRDALEWEDVLRVLRRHRGSVNAVVEALGMELREVEERWPQVQAEGAKLRKAANAEREARNRRLLERYEAGEEVGVLEREFGISREMIRILRNAAGVDKAAAREVREKRRKAKLERMQAKERAEYARQWTAVEALLRRHGGNVEAAAREQGMSRGTFLRRWPEAGEVAKEFGRGREPVAEEALERLRRLRNDGAGWEAVRQALRRNGEPRWKTWTAARGALMRYCERKGLRLRIGLSHDPERAARALALYESGLTWSQVAEHTGYGSIQSTKGAARKARERRGRQGDGRWGDAWEARELEEERARRYAGDGGADVAGQGEGRRRRKARERGTVGDCDAAKHQDEGHVPSSNRSQREAGSRQRLWARLGGAYRAGNEKGTVSEQRRANGEGRRGRRRWTRGNAAKRDARRRCEGRTPAGGSRSVARNTVGNARKRRSAMRGARSG